MEFDNVDNTDDIDLDKRVAWHHPLKRRMKLNVNRIETLDDVKLILDLQDLRIDTTHDEWEEVGYFFDIEVIPRGYYDLLEEIGHEGIKKLTFDEISEQCKLHLENKNKDHYWYEKHSEEDGIN